MALFGSTIAAADPALPPIAASSIPSQCAEVAAVPPDATISQPAISARISLANCGAGVRFAALHLGPDDASIKALADAAKPSFELLDAATKAGDANLSPIAVKARADLFAGMVVRMRNSIPPITMQTVGPALVEHDQAHAALEPKIKPWLDSAH